MSLSRRKLKDRLGRLHESRSRYKKEIESLEVKLQDTLAMIDYYEKELEKIKADEEWRNG